MKVSTFNAIAIAIGALVAASIAAIAWREASEGEFAYDGRSILITADYVAHCQSMTQECHAAADRAVDWALAHRRVTRACLARAPGRRKIAGAALIWLNAHVELHPLPADEGITRAIEAIWRCKAFPSH